VQEHERTRTVPLPVWRSGHCYHQDKVDLGVTIEPNGGVSDDVLSQLLARRAAEEDRELASYRGERT
jgi:hypothetical protein